MDNSTRWREAKERASHLQKYKGSSVWCDETIGQMAKRLAEEKPDTSVFPNIDGDWSYKRIYEDALALARGLNKACLLYTSPSPRDRTRSRMPSSA